MATDVKLDQVDGTFLVLEGRVVKSTASDLMLDSSERHKGGGPFRRALVHNQNDGLSINFNGDYPGGVTIAGLADISPQRQPGQRFPILKVHGGISYETQGIKLDGSAATIPVFLDEELGKLQIQIAALSTRVAALEAKLK